jgi:hypothetical protein
MDEMRKAHDSMEERPVCPERRQWHTPQFFVADYTAAKASNHANTDGSHPAPSLS